MNFLDAVRIGLIAAVICLALIFLPEFVSTMGQSPGFLSCSNFKGIQITKATAEATGIELSVKNHSGKTFYNMGIVRSGAVGGKPLSGVVVPYSGEIASSQEQTWNLPYGFNASSGSQISFVMELTYTDAQINPFKATASCKGIVP